MAAALDDIDFFPDLSVGSIWSRWRTPTVVRRRQRQALAEWGLEGIRDQLPSTLSSGQRRRLALASCFVRPRRLLVLDEPEQRLDRDGRRWLADRLLQEKATGTAVLMASHHPELTEAVADQVIVR